MAYCMNHPLLTTMRSFRKLASRRRRFRYDAVPECPYRASRQAVHPRLAGNLGPRRAQDERMPVFPAMPSTRRASRNAIWARICAFRILSRMSAIFSCHGNSLALLRSIATSQSFWFPAELAHPFESRSTPAQIEASLDTRTDPPWRAQCLSTRVCRGRAGPLARRRPAMQDRT